jgi:hypothetical protein
MKMTEESKQEVIQGFLVSKQEAHVAEISLRFKGKGDEADKFARDATKLSDKIDMLLAQVMDDWLGDSETVIQGIKKANTSLQQSVQNIKQGVKTAENVAKAIGFIDDLIAIATQITRAFF